MLTTDSMRNSSVCIESASYDADNDTDDDDDDDDDADVM